MKNIFKTIKERKYILVSVIISFLFAFIPFLFFLIQMEHYKYLSTTFFIPFILLLFVSYLAYFTSKKHPKITMVITTIVNLFIIVFLQIWCALFVSILLALMDSGYPITEVKYYEKALSKITDKYRIEHFPKHIPNEAYNVELYEMSGGFFGSEYITLKFNIDKKTIENELKKYKFIKTVENNNILFQPSTDNGRINLDDFTLYIINDRENENLAGHHFPYHYGIGVNKDYSQIVYYYICPD